MKKATGFLMTLIMVFTMLGVPVMATTTSYTVGGSGFTSTDFSISDGVATANADGATAVWDIDYVGDAFAKLTFKAGSVVSVTVTASGISYTKGLEVAKDEIIDFGCYTFKAGDKITVTDVGATTSVSGLELVPAETTYLSISDIDTTNSEVFSEWGSSSLKNYDGTITYQGNGTATWDIPETLSGLTEIYYYYPESPATAGKGYSDCSITFEMIDFDGNITSFSFGGAKVPAGWNKVRVADFFETTYKSITIKRGPSAIARATAFRFVENDNAYRSYLITSDNITTYGSWKEEMGSNDTIMPNVLRSIATEKPAKASYNLPNGTYYVYAHTYDNSTYQTATRLFYFNINGETYYKLENALDGDTTGKSKYFGSHQYPGNPGGTSESGTDVWDWEELYTPITVTDGILNIELVAKQQYARVDAILVTNNPFVTYETVSSEATSATKFPFSSPYNDEIEYPENYQELHQKVTSTATLANDETTVNFKLGELSDGNVSVQRQVKVGDVETVPYTDGVGFMVIRADSVTTKLQEGYYPTFYTKYVADEEEITVNTSNIFRVGKPEWLIPTTLEQIDDKTVKMTASGEMADATAIWTLEDNDLEPKVKVSITVKSGGEYSFGFFNTTTEEKKGNIGYILNPFRWQESRLPKEGTLISEAFSTTNHTQMTYKQNEQGQEITVGVAVDEESVARDENGKRRWLHNPAKYERTDNNGEDFVLDYSDEQSGFGLNTTGNNGGVLPAVFAPLMGAENSTFSANDTYTFTYRPLSTVSTTGVNQGWYDCYSHVAKDLRGVYDYRDNYFASMTDTVFNLIDLIKDDDASGWSDEMIAHYNIEDTHWATTSNGLAYLQNYLLTEDKDFLMERALPSMAYLLTRNSVHINKEYSYDERAEGPINKELIYTSASYGNSTYEGVYQMSRGQLPVFRNIAKQKYMNTQIENGSLKNPSEGLWYDIATGNSSLSTAISSADKYLSARSFASASNKIDEEWFINISYSPHFQSQLDVYEATGDEKYLEGAIESARRFLPSLRVIDMPQDKNEMYSVDTDLLYNEFKLWNKGTWWWKDGESYRRGATMKEIEDTTNSSNYVKRVTTGVAEGALVADETEFPFWVASRVGLGLEQFSTCFQANKSILMSTWAGDVLRLGYLSDDQLMMDLARSSLVGRFSNYPGYYIYAYDDTYGLKNYPTEGFDYTSFYFHHIPVLLSAVQDYLFSNAWVKSDGKVDFPSVRSQGYAWFNNRQYGAEPGTIYNEKNMWPWLKKGAVTISGATEYDAQQIDWIAGRKEDRAAFVLTNAGDKDQTVTLTFGEDLMVVDGTKATIYDKAGEITYQTISNGQVTVTVPQKGILTVAVYGDGISAPAHAKIYFPDENDGKDIDMGTSALGLMYEGNTYQSSYDGTTYKGYSTDTGYDVKAYALSLDDTAYMGYIFVGGRSTDDRTSAENKAVADGENGIVKSTLTWHYEGEETVTTVVDDKFPFEFLLPVYEPEKKIMFNVTTEFGNGETKTLGKEYTVAPNPIKQVENNYIDASDFTETAVNNTISFVADYGEFGGIKLENNRDALRDYFYYDYITKTVDDTATGLYDAETGAYVLSGVENMKKQNWSKFIDDFKFCGTYNGKTYTLPITNYATTDSHNVFQFMVDCSGYENVITKESWTKANWTDVRIVNEETGEEIPFQSFASYNFFNDCYRVCFSKIEYIAEQLPEYFYVGSKVTAQSNKKIYAYGIDGPITNSADSSAVSCKFKDEVSLKFTYNGREYTVPINRLRADSGHTALYLSITVDAFNDATDAGISSFKNVLNSENITNVKFTASKINIGAFPEGTLFVSGMNVLAENGKTGTWTDTGSNVKYIKANTEALRYAFTVPASGEYDVYCLTWDCDDSTQRAGIVLVNGVRCDFTKCTLGPDSNAPYWEPAGTISFTKDVLNVLTVPVNIGWTNSDPRFGGIAFVPTSANFEMDATLSAKLANSTTGIVDTANAGTILANVSSLTISEPVYDSQTFTVTVNGTEYTVAANTAKEIVSAYTDSRGNFIDGATVTDALAAAGLSKRNSTGEVNAVLVDGKNVYPDVTLLYDGMAITTVDGAQVTKANFSPVRKNDIVNLTYSESTPPGDGMCIYTMNYFNSVNCSSYNVYTGKLFPFATELTATTTAAYNNLINCQVHGYLSVLPSGATYYGVSAGDKVYFTGNLIDEVTANHQKIITTADASGNKTIANGSPMTVTLPDGTKAHAPYAFTNQKSLPDNSQYYDGSGVFIANTSATNDVWANKIKAGKWQLLTTGTAPCQITIVDAFGAVKSILKDQVVTGIAPLTITLEEGEKAFVWKNTPYNGTASTAGIWNMKPLCEVLTY